MPTDCHCAGAEMGYHSEECGYYVPPVAPPLTQINPELAEALQGLNKVAPESAARVLLEQTTGWTDDEHGKKTPARFVAMLRELTTPQEYDFTTFPAESQDMVIVKNIPFISVCNHHVIPFFGHAQVGYVPDQEIVGLSKIARLVQAEARSLQVQERLTRDIALNLQEQLQPLGVAVVLEAEHMCMTIRGVQAIGTTTVTSKMTGVFMDHTRTAKAEFLQLIGK